MGHASFSDILSSENDLRSCSNIYILDATYAAQERTPCIISVAPSLVSQTEIFSENVKPKTPKVGFTVSLSK